MMQLLRRLRGDGRGAPRRERPETAIRASDRRRRRRRRHRHRSTSPGDAQVPPCVSRRLLHADRITRRYILLYSTSTRLPEQTRDLNLAKRDNKIDTKWISAQLKRKKKNSQPWRLIIIIKWIEFGRDSFFLFRGRALFANGSPLERAHYIRARA